MTFTIGNNVGEVTSFIKIEQWGPMAVALAPHLKKGTQVAIEGKLRIDQVPDKTDSTKSSFFTKIVAKEIQLL